MKTKKIKLLTVFLLLLPLGVVLLGAGCEKNEENYENISLEYIRCPCDSEKSFIEEITMNEILLFDTTKTTFSEMQELSLDGDTSRFVCYNPENNNAVFYSKTGLVAKVGYICNFPETAMEWKIPADGILIEYSADVFETCKAVGSIGSWTSFSDYILTSLKKYEK